MKKFASILIILAMLGLSACATIAGAATPVEPTETPGVVAANYANALPVASQLALGTMRLKDTPQALTVDEAKTMLVLWKGMQTLASSSSSSQIEVTALLAQIQDTLRPAQLEAIAAMKLTQTDVQKALQDMASSTTAGSSRASSSSSSRSSSNNQGGGGAFFPPDGGGMPGGAAGGAGGNTRSQQNVPPSTQATIQARAAERSKNGNTLLYTAVIAYLQQVIAQ